VSTPDGLFPWERQVIESVLGAGAFDDVDFIVYWCKYRDDEFNGEQWDGWPFRRDVGTMYRVDDPNDWKHTWFVFTH
jgi:hypothetical protein